MLQIEQIEDNPTLFEHLVNLATKIFHLSFSSRSLSLASLLRTKIFKLLLLLHFLFAFRKLKKNEAGREELVS